MKSLRKKNNRRIKKKKTIKRSNTKRSSNIKRSRNIKHRRRHSNTLKKYNKKGGSYIYYMSDTDKSGETSEKTADGKPFFRKIFDVPFEEAINEFQIITILQANPAHPNIVTYYEVNPGESIDMEELITYSTDEDYHDNYILNKKELAKQIAAMKKVKDYLQGLGIIYLDWKFDNIGKSPEKDGDYKLFDFDHSGWIDTDTNEWLIKPEFLNSFSGLEDKLSPKELDDWAFNRYIIQEATRM
jgi:hypothetical protein